MTRPAVTQHRHRLAAVLCFGAIAALAWTSSLPLASEPVAVIAAGALAVAVLRRVSIFVSAYLAQCVAFFGIAAMIAGQSGGKASSLVVLWIASMTLGAVLGSGRTILKARNHRPGDWQKAAALGLPEVAVAMALLTGQGYVLLTQQAGYASQVLQGVTSPGGWKTAVFVGAPLVTTLFLVTALRSGTRIKLGALLVAIEAVLLSLTGFRGSGALYLIATGVSVLVVIPPELRPRRGRLISAAAVAAILAVASFVFAAEVKENVVRGTSAAAGSAAAYSTSLEVVAERLNSTQYLRAAIGVSDSVDVTPQLGWRRQATALVPRIAWPERPPVDYGVQVSRLVYGASGSQSSGTVTTIGDAYLNAGTKGVAGIGLVFGFVAARLESLVRFARRRELVCVAVVAFNATLLSVEPPIVLGAATVVRNVVIFGAVWLVVRAAGSAERANSRSVKYQSEVPPLHSLK